MLKNAKIFLQKLNSLSACGNRSHSTCFVGKKRAASVSSFVRVILTQLPAVKCVKTKVFCALRNVWLRIAPA